jgi:hypothetical protein
VNGLPPEASTWREDAPGWTNQDELVAVTAEIVGHLRDVTIAHLTGAKKIPPFERLLEHPDRPKPQAKKRKSKGKGKRRLATPADLARTIKSGAD